MARGFSDTRGVATSDRVEFSLARPQVRSVCFRAKFNDIDPPASFWFVVNWDDNNVAIIRGNGSFLYHLAADGASDYQYCAHGLSQDANWHTFTVEYDGSASGNSVIFYVDGALKTTNNPAGAGADGTGGSAALKIGNAGNNAIPMDGDLAEIVILDRLLTNDERTDYHADPLVVADMLALEADCVLYWRGKDGTTSTLGPDPSSVTGTADQAHPNTTEPAGATFIPHVIVV